uniref:Uncharacterized protein n=1 Tax=Arion vulgaris TaxID=1028688 RepID=A0A0B6YTI2_9EUPU
MLASTTDAVRKGGSGVYITRCQGYPESYLAAVKMHQLQSNSPLCSHIVSEQPTGANNKYCSCSRSISPGHIMPKHDKLIQYKRYKISLLSKKLELVLQWTPTHYDIPENVKANKLARLEKA